MTLKFSVLSTRTSKNVCLQIKPYVHAQYGKLILIVVLILNLKFPNYFIKFLFCSFSNFIDVWCAKRPLLHTVYMWNVWNVEWISLSLMLVKRCKSRLSARDSFLSFCTLISLPLYLTFTKLINPRKMDQHCQMWRTLFMGLERVSCVGSISLLLVLNIHVCMFPTKYAFVTLPFLNSSDLFLFLCLL